jgi:hypothetical protein
MSIKTVSKLFDEQPVRWNLRGDPHLWREMRAHFEGVPLPSSTNELAAMIESTFHTLTGHHITEMEPFFTARYNTGGMSSGYVLPKFWREEIIPLLLERSQI